MPVACPGMRHSFIDASRSREAGAKVLHELVAHGAVSVEALLAIALGSGGVGCRPILDFGREPMRELDRLMMRLWCERDDQIEIEIVPVFQLLERHRLVVGDV